MAGVVARISADGAAIQNPWVTLPGETGTPASIHVDRTELFGGDLFVATTSGGVWRIDGDARPTLLAGLGTRLSGVTTITDDPARYGPWAGKVLVGAPDQGMIFSIDLQGNSTSHQLGLNPEDFQLVPAHENFYAIDASGGRIWGAPADAFTGMIGDLLVAHSASGKLSRVRWNGDDFEVSEIAEAGRWSQMTFAPAGAVEIAGVRRVYDQIAVVRHAPEINSGRIEGALWQLSGESVVLDGTDVITSDLLMPGSPDVNIAGSPNFGGLIEGAGALHPNGYEFTITGNATLRHLITRTDPIELETVTAPDAPAGTRDITLQQPAQNAGDWSTVRNLTVSGRAGEVSVPPGTYGRFSVNGRTSLLLGVAGSAETSVYNLDSLTLTGASELRLAGPVSLTVRGGVSLAGSTVGASNEPCRLLLRMAGGELRIGGGGVLYGVVRAPQTSVIVEGGEDSEALSHVTV